ESYPQGQIKTNQMEAPLDMRVQCEVSREASRIGSTDKLLLLVHQTEGKAVAPFERVGEVKFLNQRQPAPGDEAVGHIPRERASCLLAEKYFVDIEIEHCV